MKIKLVIFVYDFLEFCHNSSIASNPKLHHPAIDFLIDCLVLSLQCGKAAAALVTCKHRDGVAEMRNCGSRWLDFLFVILLWPSYFLPLWRWATRTLQNTTLEDFFSLVRSLRVYRAF